MPTGVYKRDDINLSGIRAFNATKVGKKRPPFSLEWKKNIGKSRIYPNESKHPMWKGGITKDMKKYHNDIYKNLSEEEKKVYSWRKNKRNRVIKRIRELGSSHTYGEWENLKAQYNWTCPCCKKAESVIKLTEDHIIPLSKGGSDNIENIQPLCRSCNCKKYTKVIKY